METEMKPQVKKEWKTPELIVLVRSKPEEAVLQACKGNGTLGSATTTCVNVANCKALGTS
jgi:hypothetical protein